MPKNKTRTEFVTHHPISKSPVEDADNNLVELIELLETIDENKASAKLNEISMIDSKGGRIYY